MSSHSSVTARRLISGCLSPHTLVRESVELRSLRTAWRTLFSIPEDLPWPQLLAKALSQTVASSSRRVSKWWTSVAEVIYRCFAGTTFALLFHFSVMLGVIPVALVKVPLLFFQNLFFFPERNWGDQVQHQRHLCAFTWWGCSSFGSEHPSLQPFGEVGEQGRQKKVNYLQSLCTGPQHVLIWCLTGHRAGPRACLVSPSERGILQGLSSSHISAYR